jgi:lambda family phage minor tail protein L
LTIPLSILIEKNQLSSPHSWLMTLDVAINSKTYYFVRNTENITFKGQTYGVFPFDLASVDENSKGELPQLTLRVSNVGGILQQDVEDTDGAVGATVLVRFINTVDLAADFAFAERLYEIVSAVIKGDWMSFTLGAPNPLRKAFPGDLYRVDYCNWQFKSAECAYAGATSTCARTLDACRALNNSGRFGGYPGLGGGNLRFA